MARERKTDLEKIRQQLRKMAFGKPNDCVKLALCEDVDIEKLDLSMLTEIKRSEKGTVEIKLLDLVNEKKNSPITTTIAVQVILNEVLSI